jgi:hypothetical protein
MTFKNIEITPGIEAFLSFDIKDDTGLFVNLTQSTYRLEMFNNNGDLIFLKTTATSWANGVLKFTLSKDDTVVLTGPRYGYRLVVTDSTLVSKIYYQGFVTCSEPVFNTNSGPINTSYLPNGVLYPTGPIIVSPDVWYSVVSVYRFVITGIGTLVIDGMDLRGTVFLNRGVFVPTDGQPTQWVPELENMLSFRINVVSGNPEIKYLP